MDEPSTAFCCLWYDAGRQGPQANREVIGKKGGG